VSDAPTSNEPKAPLRWVIAALVALALGASAMWYALAFGWPNLFIESAWAEMWQLFAWLAAACVAWWRLPRTPGRRDRAMTFWLAVVCSLCAAREEDMHIYLNPDRMGDFGVSFRVAWWLDGAVPVALKLAWVVIAAALLAALLAPLARARPRLALLVLGRDPGVWLFGLGGGFLVLGYLFDDLVGRGLLMSLVASQVLEEGSETIGAALVSASVLVTTRLNLDRREAAAAARLRGAAP
jgi:hypothetical protein